MLLKLLKKPPNSVDIVFTQILNLDQNIISIYNDKDNWFFS